MPHPLKLIAAGLLAALSVQHATAELYISPVMRQSVGHEMPSSIIVKKAPIEKVASKKVVADTVEIQSTAGLRVSVSPSVSSDSSSGDKVEPIVAKPIKILSSGTAVPLPIALSQLVDNFHLWSVTYDLDLDQSKVSWKNAESHSNALDQIRSNNSLYIVKNESTKRIGISKVNSVATQLLEPGVHAWRLEAGKSLRENLNNWGNIAGWKLDFSQTAIDYPTDHGAKLVGRFEGKGGVVDRLLSATHVRTTPLNGQFYRANNVVVVVEAGYKPEHAHQPNVDQSL